MLRSEVRPAEYCLVYISYLSILYLPPSLRIRTTYYKRKYKMWDIFCCLFNFFHSVSQEGLNPYTPTPNILKIMLGNYF